MNVEMTSRISQLVKQLNVTKIQTVKYVERRQDLDQCVFQMERYANCFSLKWFKLLILKMFYGD